MLLSLSDCVKGCCRSARSYALTHKGRSRRERACMKKGYLVERLDDGRLHLLGIARGGLFVMR